jgi:hypothetical protein
LRENLTSSSYGEGLETDRTLTRRHRASPSPDKRNFLSANESRYGAGYWDAFRQAADELEAVLDGREIPPANRDLPAK